TFVFVIALSASTVSRIRIDVRHGLLTRPPYYGLSAVLDFLLAETDNTFPVHANYTRQKVKTHLCRPLGIHCREIQASSQTPGNCQKYRENAQLRYGGNGLSPLQMPDVPV